MRFFFTSIGVFDFLCTFWEVKLLVVWLKDAFIEWNKNKFCDIYARAIILSSHKNTAAVVTQHWFKNGMYLLTKPPANFKCEWMSIHLLGKERVRFNEIFNHLPDIIKMYFRVVWVKIRFLLCVLLQFYCCYSNLISNELNYEVKTKFVLLYNITTNNYY